MSESNRESVRGFLNKVWFSGWFPDHWQKALVAEFHKGNKKPLDDLASYRPISLLSVIYKMYARLIQVRLAAGIDSRIRNRQ